ncbi:MAG: hypothetical protein HZA13_08610 [Nitrospirae bacterium]|nr:hypothetical protein [Nitrospirota bacterium]
MSRQTTSKSRVVNKWETELLRLTAFLSPEAKITGQAWWKDLVGDSPERIIQSKIGGQQEEGLFEDRRLILSVGPSRIDWILATKQEEEEIIPLLGGFDGVIDPFLGLMRRWLEKCPQLLRLAFGSVLLQLVNDRESGYRQLSKYLSSVKLNPKNSFDFLYQINRPRDSDLGVENLRINRLTKWSVASWKLAQMSIGHKSINYPIGQERFACRLELDINTMADYPDELPEKKLPQIFQELVDLGKEIAIKGDIP